MKNSIATKSFAFKSDASPEGRIDGHASVFENVDNSNDRMMRGCFSKHLQKQMNEGLVKLAYNHKTVIGVAEEVTEDEHGLRVSGKISDTSLGKDVKILAADGALRHMSIKFAFTKDGFVKNKFGGRDYTDVKLLDISVVDWPDNEMANFSMKDSDSRLNDIYTLVTEIKEKLVIGAGQSLSGVRNAIESDFKAYMRSLSISDAKALFGASEEEDEYPSVWVDEVYGDYVIVCNYWAGKLYRVPYTADESGKNKFGEPKEVIRKVVFVDVASGEQKSYAGGNEEVARGGDSEVEGKDGDKPVFGYLIEKIEQKTGELEQKKTAGALSWLTQLMENKL